MANCRQSGLREPHVAMPDPVNIYLLLVWLRGWLNKSYRDEDAELLDAELGRLATDQELAEHRDELRMRENRRKQ